MDEFFDFTHIPIVGHSGTPTDREMDLINKQALEPMEPKEVYTFSSRVSDDTYDSFHSRMDEGTLENYATDFREGRSFLYNHDKMQLLGRSFNGDFRGHETLISTYVIRGAQFGNMSTDNYIRGLRGGMFKDISVRYHGGKEVCDLCNNEVLTRFCRHLPGMTYDIDGTQRAATYSIISARGAEASTVFKGSNSNAVVLKASELRTRGLLTDKDIDLYNFKHSCNLRADMNREDILSTGALLFKTDESYFARALKLGPGVK